MKKKRRRKRHGRPFYTFSVFLIVLLFVGLALAENMILNPRAKVDLSGIDSEYAILVDAGTGFKIAGKAEKEQMYPASMTKQSIRNRPPRQALSPERWLRCGTFSMA